MGEIRISFDTEKDMEEYLSDTWDEEWIRWPDLGDGYEYEPCTMESEEVHTQVRIVGANESGTDDAPIDMIAYRWFRTPEMPAGEYLGRIAMLVELKNDVLCTKHLDQLLRYFEAFKKSVEAGEEEGVNLICAALVGTGLRSDLLRIARAIPTIGFYSWSANGKQIYLAEWSDIATACEPEIKQPALVLPIGGGFFDPKDAA